MSVTPVIQTINAFNVANGITVTFNIVGNSNLIRSNKLSIYDTSNNLVATNINSSTKLENIIPPNFSGLSNGNSYYAIIDVYTTTDASGTSEGTSLGKQFWCLPTPTLVFTAPANDITISETSQEFVARFTMYPDAVIEDVENKIQFYKFNLYKGASPTQTLVKTSGEIYGTGTAISSNIYQVNYNFNELENNYEYYVELLVTTQQGMTVKAVSHNIVVSLSEETFTAAEVTNYPCEGYIEVKSNITNLLGYTNANFTDGDGVIDLTEDGKFVMWGYDPELEEDIYSLTFPTTNMNGYTLMQWSAILEVFNLNDSSSFPYNEEDTSYIFKSVDLANSRGVYLYLRRDGNTVWCELYAVSDLEMFTPTTFVQSNTLTISSDSNTHIYILIRCSRGWYDVLLSTSLPNE